MFIHMKVAIWVIALMTPVSSARADAMFIKFLSGPWGQSTLSGEPVAQMMMKPGAPQFHRKSCPPAGVALKDMVPNEVWFATLPDKRFVRVAGGGKLVAQELKFQKLDGPDTAIFVFSTTGLDGTLKVTRLSPTLIRVHTELGPMKRDHAYVRCKGLAG
jgi:hypothetical protein